MISLSLPQCHANYLQSFLLTPLGFSRRLKRLPISTRKLADLEAEARAMGATIPPRPNPAVLARLVEGGGRGSGADGGGGRGGGGRGAGRGGGR